MSGAEIAWIVLYCVHATLTRFRRQLRGALVLVGVRAGPRDLVDEAAAQLHKVIHPMTWAMR